LRHPRRLPHRHPGDHRRRGRQDRAQMGGLRARRGAVMGKTVSIDLDEDEERGETAAAVVDEDRPAVAAAADVVDEDADPLDRLPAHAVTNADGSVTRPLRFPRELQIKKLGKIRTERYDELTFHRLTGADQRAIAATSEDTMTVVAFARSTGL